VKVSIITPTYNSARTIGDTLSSVACQHWPSIEHIIIDGASKDDTLSIVRTYPHVSQLISEPDAGIYDAMNKGIQRATGDLIGILNSDDFYTHPLVLQKVIETMERSGAESCYADLEYVSPEAPERVVRNWKSGNYKPNYFYFGWMPPHPTFFVRREVYHRLGLFDTRLRTSADYELMLRFLFKNGISVCYLPDVIVRMRTGGVSNGSVANRLRANREDREAWRINGLKPRFYTFYMKPLSKIRQFL
jgi:glycosyltransferase involved in cell wall biosynthesis